MRFQAVSTRSEMGLPYHTHQPAGGWMGELIACMCGHGIGRHRQYQCEGDLRGRCTCRLTATVILQRAMLDPE